MFVKVQNDIVVVYFTFADEFTSNDAVAAVTRVFNENHRKSETL